MTNDIDMTNDMTNSLEQSLLFCPFCGSEVYKDRIKINDYHKIQKNNDCHTIICKNPTCYFNNYL